jgi:NAD(P)H dehydrogenase (quinone)
VSALCERVADAVPADGPPYAETRDVRDCAGLVMGSPAYFGNMAAPLKYFLDSTVDEWFATAFVGKPAGVFTSSASLHGGQESALLSMMLPLLHHGFFIVGLPYTDKALSATRSGGTPYGASHVTWNRADDSLSQDERTLARQLGGRVASLALQLAD